MVRKVASLVVVGVLAGLLSGQTAARASDLGEPVREVVGGTLAPPGLFPWMVRLSMGCGGVLTAPRVVLTAGHCVTGSGKDTTIGVIAGTTDLKSDAAVTARSVAVVRARGFRDETRGDDWALVRLDRPLDLPVLELSRGGADETGPMTILGWGQTSEKSVRQQHRLRYGTVGVVGDKQCAKAYRKVGVDLVLDEAICAGGRGVDTCQGDSGGPMVHRTADRRWVQVGIVSFGLGCARRAYPGVYTQVSRFQADIRAAVRKLS
ncbi:serine protease [Amorphoplanes nipponensis]|uniref:Trypsin n=1 Tax=Actinoplanes nipponensis TaxID=135950 RepID=A0A919MHV9_9ACTN|nr:serine protease [Actinoplanes nipponensis]GIE50089.1 trypsin [Actinoplanes nipponensis]